MIAVLGGLGAAAAWAITMLCTARAAQLLGSSSTLAWVMALGLVLSAPLAVGFRGGSPPSLGALGWLTLAGVANVIGLLCQYQAMRTGRVGVVAQICSAEGMVAALWAIAGGDRPGVATVACFGAIMAGLVLAVRPGDGPVSGTKSQWVALAGLAALMFGTSLYALARAGAETSVFVAILPARLLGTMFFAIPLVARGALRMDRRAVPLVVAGAAGEVAGGLSFAAGSQANIAIAAMLAAQFGAVATVAAFFVYGERLRPPQVTGIAIIAIAVGALGAFGG
jgi:drug/metabolite transporter (DMT)-like permease